jgi:hypothetical protein
LQYLTISGGHDAADGAGGGVDYDGTGTLTLATSTVSGNTAGYGGGINIKGSGGEATLTLLSHSVIIANIAGVSGGGIRLEGTSRLFALSDFTQIAANSAVVPDGGTSTGYGGGIEILGPARADIGSPGYNDGAVVVGNEANNRAARQRQRRSGAAHVRLRPDENGKQDREQHWILQRRRHLYLGQRGRLCVCHADRVQLRRRRRSDLQGLGE